MSSIEFSVEANVRELSRNLTDLAKKQVPKAANRTLNRVGGAASKAALRDVAGQAGTTQRVIKRAGFWRNLRSRARTLAYVIKVRYGAIPLRDFQARQTKKGVTAKAWGRRELYESAFKVESLGDHVFARKTSKRLPIKKLWGPQPSKLALSNETQRTIERILEQRFAREFVNNIRFYYERAVQRRKG
jgi:Prophage minor tail protein Z (GPZ).